MPENAENTVEQGNATQGAPAEPAKTFTQAEMDAIIGERLKRERDKYADYEELKTKAAAYDEAAEAAKSDLEKAVERAEKAEAELSEIKAERKRAEQVAKAAAEHGVDAELLSRMSGDVEENAAFLKAQADAQPKYGTVHDGGEVNPPAGKKSTAALFADAVNSK